MSAFSNKLQQSKNPLAFSYPKVFTTEHGKYLTWLSIVDEEVYFKTERLKVHIKLNGGVPEAIQQRPENEESLALAISMANWLTPERVRKLRTSHRLRRDTGDSSS